MNNLSVKQIKISELNPAPYNPRSWSEEAIANLTESIKRFGLVDPIIVNGAQNRRNVVIGGHFRLKVAKDLGYKEVPVVYVNIPDVEKEKELNLRLNRNTGTWDYELLKSFDLDMLLDIGFDDSDLSNIWDDALGIEDDEFNVPAELEKIKEVKTKPGNIYQLGKHRLVCGDSTNPTVLERLVGNIKVDMLYSDPPYNISLNYDKGIGTKGKYGGSKTEDNKSDTQYHQFIQSCLSNALPHLAPDSHIFTWCDENYIWLLQQTYQELGINHKRVCLWIKNNQNATPQIAFNKAYEPCVYGTIGNPYLNSNIRNLNEVLNKEVGTGNRLLDDIEDYLNIWLVKRLSTLEYEHPTQKPVTLHEKPLRRCTKPGDKVLDLFGGSGSTLIACEQLKRKAYLVEIDPVFCDLIIRRYENLTKRYAKLIS